MLTVVIIPVVILVSTIVVYIMLDPAFASYLQKLEDKTRTMQKISILITSSNLVNFFSRSEASRVVETLLTRTQDDPNSLEDVLLDLGDRASGEIETLYQEVKKGYKPMEYLSRVKVASTLLRIIVLFYGASISISELILIYLKFSSNLTLFSVFNGIIFGGTIVSSALVMFMIGYISNASRKIDGNFARLQADSTPAYL